MIDIHSHVIHNVDDGPLTIEDSLKMLAQAAKLGIHTIVATPHYSKNIYSSERVVDNFNELKLKSQNIGLELFLGYENFLCTSFADIMSNRNKYTLNNSNYLLFELPFKIMPIGIIDTIEKLNKEGLVPIIAHPERSQYFVRNIDSLLELVASNCLIQLDAASIIGVYGYNIKRFAKKLIKRNLVSFVASDAHTPKDYRLWYQKAIKNVRNWAGDEYCKKVFCYNQMSIVGSNINQDIAGKI